MQEHWLLPRARFVALVSVLLFPALWAVMHWPFDDGLDRSGTPLGGDYPMFYIAGRMVLEGEVAQLYDVTRQQQRLQAMFPAIDPDYCLPYRYPPFVALLMAPLAALPYTWSWLLFSVASCAALIAAAAWLMSAMQLAPETRRAAWWLVAGWPVAWETLLGGQASHVALLIVAGSCALIAQRRWLLAGVVLGCALYKPNVLALFVLGCVLRFPRLVCGMLLTLAVAGVLSVLVVGPAGVWQYLHYGSQLALAPWQLETPYWKVHGLARYVQAIAPHHARQLVLAAGLLTMLAVVHSWRRAAGPQTQRRGMLLLLLVNGLFNPYVPIYDLVTLLAAALLVIEECDSIVSHNAGVPTHRWAVLPGLLLLLACGPHLSQALCRSLDGLQLFPLLLAAALAWLMTRQPATPDKEALISATAVQG